MKTGGKYKGIMTALITPLKEDRQTVDTKALQDLVEWQLTTGVKSFLVLGGSGEYSALSMDQRLIAVKTVVETVKGRVPVMAGVLEPGLGECLKVCKAFKAAGVDSLLVLTPFYVHGSQEGLYQFYKTIDEEVQFPFAVYNIPYRTMVDCKPATINRLAKDCPHMIGMKECAPALSQSLENVRLSADLCDILSGEESIMAALVGVGAEGGIMATANLLPELFVKMYDLGSQGKLDEAMKEQAKYADLINLLFSEPNPGPMKYAMALAGRQVGPVSLPLLPPSDQLKADIKAEMTRLGLVK